MNKWSEKQIARKTKKTDGEIIKCAGKTYLIAPQKALSKKKKMVEKTLL